MATALTTIFGSELCVTAQPQIVHRQYTGFPGANGLTSIHLGTRGRQIFIAGRLRASGSNYSNARQNLVKKIADIDALRQLDQDVATYTYQGEAYYDCSLDTFELLRDQFGKAIHYKSNKECFCDFVAAITSQR
ncbi:MAG: hypothetical protein PHF37_10690 [Phycisphaerae bacterium]|nr:hypothetical protein [Phycisphaerae bacterium]